MARRPPRGTVFLAPLRAALLLLAALPVAAATGPEELALRYEACAGGPPPGNTRAFLRALQGDWPAGSELPAERRRAAETAGRQAVTELLSGSAGASPRSELCGRLVRATDEAAHEFFASICFGSPDAFLQHVPPRPPAGEYLARLAEQCGVSQYRLTAAHALLASREDFPELRRPPAFAVSCRIAVGVLAESVYRDWDRLAPAHGFDGPRCRLDAPLPRLEQELSWVEVRPEQHVDMAFRVNRTLCEASASRRLPDHFLIFCREALAGRLERTQHARLFRTTERAALAPLARVLETCAGVPLPQAPEWARCVSAGLEGPNEIVASSATAPVAAERAPAPREGSGSALASAFDGSRTAPDLAAAPPSERPRSAPREVARSSAAAEAAPGPRAEERAEPGTISGADCAAGAAVAALPTRAARLAGRRELADCRRDAALTALEPLVADARALLERLARELPADRAVQRRTRDLLDDLPPILAETDAAARSRRLNRWMERAHRYLTSSDAGFLGEGTELAASEGRGERTAARAAERLVRTRAYRRARGAEGFDAALDQYLLDHSALTPEQNALLEPLLSDRAGREALDRLSRSSTALSEARGALAAFRREHPEVGAFEEDLGRFQTEQSLYLRAALAAGPRGGRAERLFTGAGSQYVVELGSRYDSWGATTESQGGTRAYRSWDGHVTATAARDSEGAYTMVRRTDSHGRLVGVDMPERGISQRGRWDAAGRPEMITETRRDGTRVDLAVVRDATDRVTMTAEQEYDAGGSVVSTRELDPTRGEGVVARYVEPRHRALASFARPEDAIHMDISRLAPRDDARAARRPETGPPDDFNWEDLAETRRFQLSTDGQALVFARGGGPRDYAVYTDGAAYDRDPSRAWPRRVEADLTGLIAARGDRAALERASLEVADRIFGREGAVGLSEASRTRLANWLADTARTSRDGHMTFEIPEGDMVNGRDLRMQVVTEDESGRRLVREARYDVGADWRERNRAGTVIGITNAGVLAATVPIEVDAEGRPVERQADGAGLIRDIEYLSDGRRRRHEAHTHPETSWTGAGSNVTEYWVIEERRRPDGSWEEVERQRSERVVRDDAHRPGFFTQLATAAGEIPLVGPALHYIGLGAETVAGTVYHGAASGGDLLGSALASGDRAADYRFAALVSAYNSPGHRALMGRDGALREIRADPAVQEILTTDIRRGRREELERQGLTVGRLGMDRYRELVESRVRAPISDDDYLNALAGHSVSRDAIALATERRGRGDALDRLGNVGLGTLGVLGVAGEHSATGVVFVGEVALVGRVLQGVGAFGAEMAATGRAYQTGTGVIRAMGVGYSEAGGFLEGMSPLAGRVLHAGMQTSFAASVPAGLEQAWAAHGRGDDASMIAGLTRTAVDGMTVVAGGEGRGRARGESGRGAVAEVPAADAPRVPAAERAPGPERADGAEGDGAAPRVAAAESVPPPIEAGMISAPRLAETAARPGTGAEGPRRAGEAEARGPRERAPEGEGGTRPGLLARAWRALTGRGAEPEPSAETRDREAPRERTGAEGEGKAPVERAPVVPESRPLAERLADAQPELQAHQDAMLRDAGPGGAYALMGRFMQFFARHGRANPLQGIKFHVTALPENAARVARVVGEYLRSQEVAHKIVRADGSTADLATFFGREGTQRGKFITVYPESPARAAELMGEIDALLLREGLTNADPGLLPPDIPYGRSGLLSWRAGRISSRPAGGARLFDANGEEIPPEVIREDGVADDYLRDSEGRVLRDEGGRPLRDSRAEPRANLDALVRGGVISRADVASLESAPRTRAGAEGAPRAEPAPAPEPAADAAPLTTLRAPRRYYIDLRGSPEGRAAVEIIRRRYGDGAISFSEGPYSRIAHFRTRSAEVAREIDALLREAEVENIDRAEALETSRRRIAFSDRAARSALSTPFNEAELDAWAERFGAEPAAESGSPLPDGTVRAGGELWGTTRSGSALVSHDGARRARAEAVASAADPAVQAEVAAAERDGRLAAASWQGLQGAEGNCVSHALANMSNGRLTLAQVMTAARRLGIDPANGMPADALMRVLGLLQGTSGEGGRPPIEFDFIPTADFFRFAEAEVRAGRPRPAGLAVVRVDGMGNSHAVVVRGQTSGARVVVADSHSEAPLAYSHESFSEALLSEGIIIMRPGRAAPRPGLLARLASAVGLGPRPSASEGGAEIAGPRAPRVEGRDRRASDDAVERPTRELIRLRVPEGAAQRLADILARHGLRGEHVVVDGQALVDVSGRSRDALLADLRAAGIEPTAGPRGAEPALTDEWASGRARHRLRRDLPAETHEGRASEPVRDEVRPGSGTEPTEAEARGIAAELRSSGAELGWRDVLEARNRGLSREDILEARRLAFQRYGARGLPDRVRQILRSGPEGLETLRAADARARTARDEANAAPRESRAATVPSWMQREPRPRARRADDSPAIVTDLSAAVASSRLDSFNWWAISEGKGYGPLPPEYASEAGVLELVARVRGWSDGGPARDGGTRYDAVLVPPEGGMGIYIAFRRYTNGGVTRYDMISCHPAYR